MEEFPDILKKERIKQDLIDQILRAVKNQTDGASIAQTTKDTFAQFDLADQQDILNRLHTSLGNDRYNLVEKNLTETVTNTAALIPDTPPDASSAADLISAYRATEDSKKHSE